MNYQAILSADLPDVSLQHIDVIQVSPLPEKSSISIEQVRELTSRNSFAPQRLDKTWVIISPADALTVPAQQALLKFLEEPPENTQIVLVTTKPYTLLPTIRSRCVEQKAKGKRQPVHSEGRQAKGEEKLPPTYSDAIKKSDSLSKREDALDYIQDILVGEYSAKEKQGALAALSRLHANTNVKLTMDTFFFLHIGQPL